MATKVSQLREELGSEILAGRYRLGQRLPSARQLADRHDVSVLTANLAMKELRDRRLIDIRRGSGAYVTYDPSKSNSKRSVTIGLAYLDAYQRLGNQYNGSHPAVLQWMGGLQDHFVLDDLSIKTIPYRRDELGANGAIDPQSVDGLLITGPINTEEMDRLSDQGIPVVLLGHRVDDQDERPAPSVLTDAVGGFRRLAMQLRDLGHERIAMIAYSAGPSLGRPRQTAFVAAIRAAGFTDFTPDDLYIVENEHHLPTRAVYREQAERAIASKPTAIITSDEVMANFVIATCYEKGLRIPQDMSLATRDDPTPKNRPVELTRTNNFDAVRDATRYAAELLDRVMSGDTTALTETVIAQTTVIESESTAPPAKLVSQSEWEVTNE